MLKKAELALKNVGLVVNYSQKQSNIASSVELFLVHDDLDYFPWMVAAFDLIYSIDCMVHMDLHTIYRWLTNIEKLLKPGGHAVITVADITAKGCWQRFKRQSRYSVGGFYFVCPEMMKFLSRQCGLEWVTDSKEMINSVDKDANDHISVSPTSQASSEHKSRYEFPAVFSNSDSTSEKHRFSWTMTNMYLHRDLLIILKKPGL
eukprot:GHVL01024279.1.p1 GENE.GHVL01024279.1~~GHVL01024279.1.p1  ORF type:complete len:204 (+),score=17.76 GHVL01024279.1:423-1034(+)